MKAIKFLAVAVVVLFVGVGNMQAVKLNQQEVIKQMVKEIQRDISRSFLNKDIELFVDNGEKTRVFVTLRVCNNCCIEVLKVEGATKEIQALVKKTINKDKVKTDEICKYRRFRVPLTFVYRE